MVDRSYHGAGRCGTASRRFPALRTVRAGGMTLNHNQTLARPAAKGLKVKTAIRAGGMTMNHNQTLVR